MSIKDDDLMAAINGAIDGTAPPTQETNDDDDTTGAADAAGDGDAAPAGSEDDDAARDAAADSVASDESTDAADDATAEGGDAAEEPSAEAIGAEGAKGKKQGKEGEGDLDADGKPLTAEARKAKREAEEKENAEAAKQDPINAPISPYLKAATQERMHTLVNIAKQQTQQIAALQQDRNDMIKMVMDTGASAQQYRAALDYLAAVNSREPEQIKAAINFLQQEIVALSRIGGVAVPGVNLYEGHPDLASLVQQGKVTAEVANEAAAARDSRQIQTRTTQQNNDATRQAQEAQQREHAAGIQALNDIGKQLASQDPAYKVKAQAVLAKIGADLQKSKPSTWANKFLIAYTTYVAPRPARPATPKPTPRQPLRANNPSGGQQGKAGSLEEAISLGIAAGSRQ